MASSSKKLDAATLAMMVGRSWHKWAPAPKDFPINLMALTKLINQFFAPEAINAGDTENRT